MGSHYRNKFIGVEFHAAGKNRLMQARQELPRVIMHIIRDDREFLAVITDKCSGVSLNRGSAILWNGARIEL